MFSAEPRASCPVFMFSVPRLVFIGTVGVDTHFNVLRSVTHFRRYRGRPFPFCCFPLPDMFSAISSASGPVFIFSAPGHVFGGTEGVGSRFHVLRSRTRFRRYRVRRASFSCFVLPDSFRRYRRRRVPFSCFAPPNSFSPLQRASGPVFMFCAPELIFGVTEGVRSRFHVLCFRTRFRRYRGRQILFPCFALPDSFSTVPRMSGPVFLICAPGLVFGGNIGVGSRFYVLRSQTRFQRYRGRRLPFSCFAHSDSFSAEPRASR
jgi:hypothetical protein